MPRHRRSARAPAREVPERQSGSNSSSSIKTRIRIVQLALLTLYSVVVVLGIAWLHLEQTIRSWATCIFGLSLLLVLSKALDERPSASRKRAKYRVWPGVQATVQDGLRMISVAAARTSSNVLTATPTTSSPPSETPSSSPKAQLSPDLPGSEISIPASPRRIHTALSGDLAEARSDELLAVIASFPIALLHHLLGTRALPHAPLIDLLPSGYLSSLKRTEARVRFAAAHAGPSGSGSPPKNGASAPAPAQQSEGKVPNGQTDEEWEDAGNGKNEADGEPPQTPGGTPATPATKKSNLGAPYPANLPLALLRLMEAYILGLADLPVARGGWSASQADRALDVVKGLNHYLSETESVYADPPPFVNLGNALNFVLLCAPPFLACAVRTWRAILITIVAGSYVKLSLEPTIEEPDPSAPNHPLKQTLLHNLHEALDTCPSLARYYRARLVTRLGGDSDEVHELDRRTRRRDEWLPTF
ncbi:hypothetical protein Q8F55_001253 [Vanrija albida]|uniref:Proteophosphoglycan ppg4 n=1 Tax=Vanrija albida TaxID=181172 RepID=A0ABR3QFH9_9TREE